MFEYQNKTFVPRPQMVGAYGLFYNRSVLTDFLCVFTLRKTFVKSSFVKLFYIFRSELRNCAKMAILEKTPFSTIWLNCVWRCSKSPG